MVEPIYLFCVTFWSDIRTFSIHRTARSSPFLYSALRPLIIAHGIKNDWYVSGCEYGSPLNFTVESMEQEFAVWTRFMDPFLWSSIVYIVYGFLLIFSGLEFIISRTGV